MKERSVTELYEICRDIITTECNLYFSAKSLIDDVVAKLNGVSLKHVLNGSKGNFNPYAAEKKAIRWKVTQILRKLQEQGKITKYSKTTWKKVKA